MPNYVFYLLQTIMLFFIQLFIYAQIYNSLFVFLIDFVKHFMISLLLNI